MQDPAYLGTKKQQPVKQLIMAKVNQEELEDPRVLAVPRNKLEAKLSREKKAQTDHEDEVKFVKSKLDHTIHVMLYLILARRNSAVLLTMDKKLKAVALKSGVEVSLEL